MFAGKRESRHNQQTIVELQNDYFNVTPRTRMPCPGLIDAAHAADVSASTLDPFTSGDYDASILRTWCDYHVPPVYAPLFLAVPLALIQAWEVDRAQIVLDAKVTDFKLLIDFLRLAIASDGILTSVMDVDLPTATLTYPLIMDLFHITRSHCFPQLNPAICNVQNN